MEKKTTVPFSLSLFFFPPHFFYDSSFVLLKDIWMVIIEDGRRIGSWSWDARRVVKENGWKKSSAKHNGSMVMMTTDALYSRPIVVPLIGSSLQGCIFFIYFFFQQIKMGVCVKDPHAREINKGSKWNPGPIWRWQSTWAYSYMG